MGKKVLPRAVAETRVQAMQLKLFIETSVLQKHEKPRYKAVAREAYEENTQERNRKRRKPRSRVLREGWKTKRQSRKSQQFVAPLNYTQGMGVERASYLIPPPLSSFHLGPINPWLPCFRDITQTLVNILPSLPRHLPAPIFTLPS